MEEIVRDADQFWGVQYPHRPVEGQHSAHRPRDGHASGMLW